MAIHFDEKLGRLVATREEREMVDALLREAYAGLGSPSSDHLLAELGLAVTQPIRKFADYTEGFADVFLVRQVEINDDKRYPIEEYDILAHQTSLDGGFITPRVGSSWGEMAQQRLMSGFSIHDLMLATTPYNIVEQKIAQVGQELARKRDEIRKGALSAAAASVSGHVVTVTGGAFTKTAVDAIFDAAALLGYQIEKVICNRADVNKMRGWPNDPFGPGLLTEQIARNGFIGNYGGAMWRETRACSAFQPGVSDGEMYFLVSADRLGYEIRTPGTSETQRDPRNRETHWFFDEYLGCAVANPYGVWKLVITA